MKKRAQICFYIFVVCAFVALGIIGYFILRPGSDEVMVGSKKFVTFNALDVPECSSYLIEVTNSDNESDSAVYSFTKEKVNDSTYKFNTIVTKDEQEIAEESYTQEITNVNSETDKINCNIKEYTVKLLNSTGQGEEDSIVYEYVDQTLENVDKDIFCVIVSEYFDDIFDLDGKYTISCTPQNDEGQPIDETEEVEFDYVAYYEQDFLRRDDFYYNGDYYDYVIESVDELDALVAYAILYRYEDLSFYVKTNAINSSNINSLVIDAAIDYPEYDALQNQNTYASMKQQIGYLLDFNYYLDENFTKTYLDLKSEDESVYLESLESLHTKDTLFKQEYIREESDTPRTFPIDSAENEVVVYNTEQLFMVVQSGAKPKFIEGESDIASQVYENAREILKEINNSDNLSDYEKALNIYRYIVSNIVYDHVLYKYMELKGDFSIRSFGDYSAFYLEGVFYDFDGLDTQFAVCDGLAKAYSLMCNIEGIECVKVNGSILGQGNHAWNKIYLEAEEEYNLETGYYYVDTTWGEGSYNEQDIYGRTSYTQFLTHTYFLFSQDYTERAIEYEYDLEMPEGTEAGEYNYYTDSTLGEGINLYIDSDEDLLSTLEFVRDNLASQTSNYLLELYISKDYLMEGSQLFNRLVGSSAMFGEYNIEYLYNYATYPSLGLIYKNPLVMIRFK